MFDEIYIRKKVVWLNQSQRYYGHISYGMKEDDVLLPIANQAIVFMLSGINRQFEFPLCYHLITALDACDKAALVKELITKVAACGAMVKNISLGA